MSDRRTLVGALHRVFERPGNLTLKSGRPADVTPPAVSRIVRVSPAVAEARSRLVMLARKGGLRSGLQSEFGYWKPEPFRAAKVVPVSTWALKAQGIAFCVVCAKSLEGESEKSRGLCSRHVDWRIVWVHHSWSGAELNNGMADQLERMIRQYESENRTDEEEEDE